MKWECEAASIKEIAEVIKVLPYGSRISIAFQLLYMTGCRMDTELINMQYSHITESGEIWWRLGKNQTHKKPRHAKLSPKFLKELAYYRSRTISYPDRVFPINDFSNVRGEFDNEIRPLLSAAWHERLPIKTNKGFKPQHALQCKSFRKSYATLLWMRWFKKYGDANMAALMASKAMEHSTMKITADHYIRSMDKFKDIDPDREIWELVEEELKMQTKLIQYEMPQDSVIKIGRLMIEIKE